MANPRVEYVPIIDRKPLKLPDNARVAVWAIINVEEWDINEPMARTVLPAPQGARVVPDIPNYSWFEYGLRVGFWRLNVYNVADYRQERTRMVADNLTGAVFTEHSVRRLTPRWFLTLGTRF